MRQVFVDTLYWIGVFAPGDPWREPAKNARSALGESVHLVTTEEVLTELLTALAGRGPYVRRIAGVAVRSIMTAENVTVLPQSHESFMAGLALYEARADKGYSLVDCVSMNAMREAGITEILTNDHHFAQEGFSVLIQN